jgi:hypothetical protein
MTIKVAILLFYWSEIRCDNSCTEPGETWGQSNLLEWDEGLGEVDIEAEASQQSQFVYQSLEALSMDIKAII